ncbi:phenylalanine--tRNA ligase subunit beta [Alteromonas oceanisediminis]|uniref:phenylalanine--tRNA ligase subunit beta n=1 Tax=Alteromonas oceanisediminis TaxID=2836180 RepID=UPI001BDB2CDC|nr:phenylalanine--tRNA ligase subunit beta [Alteromonas oceanisediminis]MBT0587273.1 phenylalanine--tRNA ligase subunit beta [Alteromonas oceanisediminis]
MKFSEKWLREWVSPDLSSEQLSEQLSMAGLEVDGIEPVASDFSGVVIGEVVECGPHPDADKLQVTKINVGDEELLDIVCGAPNCRQGLRVAVAKVGAVLPGNFKIKKAKLRGQPSFGMLCSFSELGMGEDHSGILELPQDAPIGTDIREYLGLDDIMIDVDLTPNRADCLGIRGLAREVGVLNQLDVSPIEAAPVTASINETRDIELHAPEACPRYLGRVIKGINLNTQSPLWLKEKLRRSGVRSIDPVVDVTNYVLLELGHPMHAFDLQALSGNVVVRMAHEKESLTLLDESTVELHDNTLVIADQEKALAIAGVFGGLQSGVTATSQDIFLESAFFHPDAITGKARQYGLHTDASHRYERGVDPQLQRDAMERATGLLLDIVGGNAGPIVEAVSEQHIPAQTQVSLRRERLDRVLGHTINDEQVSDILHRLGLDPAFENGEWITQAPSYRFDIAIEEDLIEEVARVYGYNRIPNNAPQGSLSMLPATETQVSLNSLKQVLIQRGYTEAITYSFVDPKLQNALFPDHQGLVLPHPISSEMSIMRVSLWTGLLQAVGYNQNRQQQRVRLFESGLRFIPDTDGENGLRQELMLSGVIAGNQYDIHWDHADNGVDFFDIKGDVEAVLTQCGISKQVDFVAATQTALHPGQAAQIMLGDDVIGWIGAVHPQFQKAFGLTTRTFVFELFVDAIVQRELPQAQAISKYPANRRDIAITVDESVSVGNIRRYVENIGVNQLVDLNLFDVYRGKGIEPGKKSLALSLILQDADKTLEEAEIQQAVDKVVAGLESQFGAALRE